MRFIPATDCASRAMTARRSVARRPGNCLTARRHGRFDDATRLRKDSRLTYRPDIDGLRAVAVLSVLAYHYGALLPGGFVGVDVFFVISGYLITRQIVDGLTTG